ncbi:MAG: hypothetical protein WA184_24115, partial [Stellaceae bacterium]
MAEMNPLHRRMIRRHEDPQPVASAALRGWVGALQGNPAALHNVLGFERIYNRRSAKIESRHVTNHP